MRHNEPNSLPYCRPLWPCRLQACAMPYCPLQTAANQCASRLPGALSPAVSSWFVCVRRRRRGRTRFCERSKPSSRALAVAVARAFRKQGASGKAGTCWDRDRRTLGVLCAVDVGHRDTAAHSYSIESSDGATAAYVVAGLALLLDDSATCTQAAQKSIRATVR